MFIYCLFDVCGLDISGYPPFSFNQYSRKEKSILFLMAS